MALSKSVFYTLLSQVPQFASGVFVSILSTRILGPEGKGAYSVLFYEAALIGLLLNLGIHFSTVYFLSRKQITTDRVLGIGSYHLALNVLLLSGFFIVLWFGGGGTLLFPKGHYGFFFLVYLGLAFVLGYINSLLSAVFQGNKNFRRVNQSVLLKAILSAAVFSVLYVMHESQTVTLEAVLFSLLLLLVCETIYWIIFYTREFGLWPSFGRSMIPDIQMILAFSVIGYVSNLVNFFNYRLDIWVIEYFLPLQQLGFYVLAVNLAQMLWMVSEPISAVIAPHLNDPETRDKSSSFLAFHRLNTSSVLVLSLLGWVLAEMFIPFVYGAAFTSTIAPFRILLLGNFFACASKTYGVFNYINNRINYNLYATAMGLVVSLILDFTLIPLYGIQGAAWASNMAYMTIFVFLYLITRFRLNLKTFNPFIFTRRDFQILTHGQRS